MTNVVEILKERGLLEAVTGPGVEKTVSDPTVVYAGFDPTSHSLQLGNLVAIIGLAHFQRCGHRPIAVVGGATGLIGDPSGKSDERVLLTEDDVRQNAEGIRENLSRFLDFDHPTAPAVIVNNYDWLNSFTFIEFLRDVGKHFRIGSMLNKESVRVRVESESGMSFTEFSYQLLQGYDFLHLHDEYECKIQVGGSDQWGNITAGIDLARKVRGVEVHGLTFPLVCDSRGQKFGKSEGGAVYLDSSLTSQYSFYQFLVRTADADVVRFLKLFTFLSLDQVSELEAEMKANPEKRVAQKALAEEVTRAVHGEEGLAIAQRASEVMFGGSMEGLRAADLENVFADVPSSELPRGDVIDTSVVDFATMADLCKSKGEARRLIEGGGMYINNERVSSIEGTVATDSIIDDRLVVLRSGKKTFRLVRVV